MSVRMKNETIFNVSRRMRSEYNLGIFGKETARFDGSRWRQISLVNNNISLMDSRSQWSRIMRWDEFKSDFSKF